MSKIVLSEQNVRNFILPGMKATKYLSELKNKKLLPLFSNDKRLPLIARLIGSLFSDGGLYHSRANNYREIHFTLGQKEDAQELTSDLCQLGFKAHVRERVTQNKVGGREFQLHTHRVKCCSTALWVLFVALDVPVGKKTKQNYFVPDWILCASSEVKKEFLKGYIGGDGPKVTVGLTERKKKQPCNTIQINDIEFYKQERFLDSGLKYALQLKELLACFDVDVTRIFSKELILNEQKIQVIHISISSAVKSAYAYCKLGYAYCKQKQDAITDVTQFLELLRQKRTEWSQKYLEALDLYNSKNKSIIEISKSLNLSKNTVYGWVKQGKKPTIGYHKIKYPAWLNERYQNGNRTKQRNL